MHFVVSLLVRFLALYLGLTTSLFSMSYFGSQTASFYARLLSSYATLSVCAIYGVIASIVLRLVGYHRISQWTTARSFKYAMALTVGVKFEVLAGQEHLKTRPAVFVGNHQTALDILLLATIFPRYCSVTAKKSLRMAPFLGWFMALSGTVFIDRANRTTAMKAFEGAAAEIKRHRQSVFIFPEGTRSNAEEPTLLDFKKGAFHLAIQAGVPIVPIVAGCYWGVLGVREGRFRKGRIPVMVLPPIPTTNLTADDVEELTRYTREIMLRALTKLTESPPGQRAYRADGTFTTISKSQSSADAGEDDKGKSSAVAADGAGDGLRRNVVQKEMEKRAAEDGLAD